MNQIVTMVGTIFHNRSIENLIYFPVRIDNGGIVNRKDDCNRRQRTPDSYEEKTYFIGGSYKKIPYGNE